MEIYFDNASTTRPLEETIAAMMPYLRDNYGNPSAIYAIGRRAHKAIDDARDLVADTLGVKSKEIVFCSGSTESICTLIIGAAMEVDEARRKFVTSRIEHKAVLKTAKWLKENLGWRFTFVDPEPSGHIDADKFVSACSDGCGLASLAWVNNELGTIQPVEEIAKKLKGTGTVFHVDMVQGIGKLALNLNGSGIDMASASAHKFYGPKGCGFSYIRDGSVSVKPLIVGGGQELEYRAGTENVPGIVGTATALSIVTKARDELHQRQKLLTARMLEILDEAGIEYEINGEEPKAPGFLNIFFPGIESESLLLHADREGVCLSAGSACSAGSSQPSYVISALGHEKLRGLCSARFTLGWHNTMEEVEEGTRRIAGIVARLRGNT